MKSVINFLIPVVICVIYSCSAKPFKESNKIYQKQSREFAASLKKIPLLPIRNDSILQPAFWAGTVNFNLRKPHFVIIHHTGQESCAKTLKTFIDIQTQVSAHYVICKDGTIHHMLNDYLRAWHAGVASWGNISDINSVSLGIELDNNGKDTFPLVQLNALKALLHHLKSSYNIPAANFIGHSDIAPGRKIDPNIYFPWKEMANYGFGLWYRDTSNIIVPSDFNVADGLRILGYDKKKFDDSLSAFRQHFLQTEKKGDLSDAELKILYNLVNNPL